MRERRVGFPLPQDVKVADVINRPTTKYDTAGNQPIQSPYTPAVVTPASVGIKDPGAKLTFFYAADWGGIEDPTFQKYVIAAMAALLPTVGPAFLYIGGDWVYFNCDPPQWMNQFYQLLAHLPLPAVGIPGNHDGDGTDGVEGSGLLSWLANLCTSKPMLPPSDPSDEFGRDTQTQPSHDWGLELEAATILGAWDNVASGGHLEPEQIAWLTQAMKEAPTDRPVIYVGHHPSYSISADGGSSPELNRVLNGIWAAAKRWPDLILSGHVHDYQHFVCVVEDAWQDGEDKYTFNLPYIVCGNGGYHNLHPIAGDYSPGMTVAPNVTCEYADGANWGFLIVTAEGGKVSGEYVAVDKNGDVTRNADTF
jgi:predicted MPP superfamily phosphohydrolase